MFIKLSLSIFIVVLTCIFAVNSDAQTLRKAVSGAEVTGTFRSYYSGKFKGSYDEIKILALGQGKVKISFDLTYPFVDPTGEMSANVGMATGTAEITGDTAIYTDSEECKITIKFLKSGAIKVTQDGTCGFGFNVSADGTYKKFSGAKPKFEN